MASKRKFSVQSLNNQKMFLYVVLAGLAVFLAFYMFVYQKLEEKTRDIHSENVNLRTRVEELKEVYDNMEGYKLMIDAMDKDIHEKLSIFPADVREEDALVTVVDMLNKAYVEYTTINIAGKEDVYEIPKETVVKAGLDDYNDKILVQKRTVAYVNNTDYINLKTLVENILEYGGVKKISNIIYSKNDGEKDSFLTGTIEVTDYMAEGTGAEYVAPDLKDYEAGLYDLFGIVRNPNR
ncbi:MAG: hypothetical protein J5717_00975 [Lachnospiraceae bacterium]|nr:hypothetical protein [Lachnospiraceae bacterium]MBR4795844.1 hypothetical protein [Lachnospiraceae bacterium]